MKNLRSKIFPINVLDNLSFEGKNNELKAISDRNKPDFIKLKLLSNININNSVTRNRRSLQSNDLNKAYSLTNNNTNIFYKPNSRKFVDNFQELYDFVVVDNLPKNHTSRNVDSISYYLNRLKFLKYNNNLSQLKQINYPKKRNRSYNKYEDQKYQTFADISQMFSNHWRHYRSSSQKKPSKSFFNYSYTPKNHNTINDIDYSNTDIRKGYKNLFTDRSLDKYGNKEFEYCFKNLDDENNYKNKHKGPNKYNNEIERIREYTQNRNFAKFKYAKKNNIEKQLYNLKTSVNLKLIKI